MSLDVPALQIVRYPDPALRRKSAVIDPSDPVVRQVALRMIDLMHEADGVGLAAPQVGLAWRLFVTNARDADPTDRVFINPTLTLARGAAEADEEGCLSVPDIRVQVRRAPAARIEAIDIDGRPVVMEAEGFLARVWQHETDHLDGVLIIDRMSPLDRLTLRSTIRALEQAAPVAPMAGGRRRTGA